MTLVKSVNFVNPLENILLRDLCDYMIYDFEAKFLNEKNDNDETLNAVIHSLMIVIGKYRSTFSAFELEMYIYKKVFNLVYSGYRPTVKVSEEIIENYLEYLSCQMCE